jgi:hypothetical protein
MLSTIAGFGRTSNFLTMTNEVGYQSDINKFFKGLTLRKNSTTVNNVVAKTAGTQSTTKVNPTPCFSTKNGIEGVWMGIYVKEFYGDPLTMGHTIWKTFYNNGQVYEPIPDIGFAEFNNRKRIWRSSILEQIYK